MKRVLSKKEAIDYLKRGYLFCYNFDNSIFSVKEISTYRTIGSITMQEGLELTKEYVMKKVADRYLTGYDIRKFIR